MTKKKLLYVASHLSTGGMPQYLLKQIQIFKDEFDISVIEYNDHSGDAFTVQKNQIKDLVDLYTLYEDKEENFLKIVDKVKPDIIHFTEIPEHFIESTVLDKIFGNKRRKYNIVCSTHGSLTNPDEIRYQPDRYVLVSEWSRQKFEHLGIDTQVWEYPIENIKYDKDSAKAELGFEKDWKHVLMVGLFSSGKNQGEIFQVARTLEKYKIKFHFVGNQAGNFKDYWEPIMNFKPNNCVVWGERTDVDKFYKASDLFYFSSKLELNPLSIKEALSYGLPCIFRKLHTYLDTYDGYDLVQYINDDIDNTKRIILNTLNPQFNEIPGWFSYEKFYNEIIEALPDNSHVVEVGSWMGKSTNHFISKSKDSGKKIHFTAVDTFKGSEGYDDLLHKTIIEPFDNDLYTEFSNNSIIMNNFENINVVKDTSKNASNLFLNNSQDFVMIDAGHEYDDVKQDIESWFYKVKPGGIIGGDDFGTNLFQGLTRAVDEYFYGQIQTKEGWVWYRKRPRIQIKHMMTRPDDIREIVSSKSLKQLQRWGFDYQPIVNEVYDGLPPKEFCRRPNDISETPSEFKGDQGIGNITGRHYGCYLAHRNALETIDEENYDYTLIFEADAFIYSNLKDFVDVVHKACFVSERDDVPYIGFANNPSWNKIKDVDDSFWQTDYNQDWAHAYLIPNRDKQWYMNRIEDCEWDVADLWYNHVFYHHQRPRYTTHYRYSKQAEGLSLLDNTNKSWK